MTDSFNVLHDGDYKVYRRDGDLISRYTVAAPGGSVLACTSTVWGARRVIRRHKAKVQQQGGERNFWDGPIVHREEAS